MNSLQVLNRLIELDIIGAILFALSISFYLVTYVLKLSNDKGDSTGDRFHYVQSYENLVERDHVSASYDIHTFDHMDEDLNKPFE